MYERDKRGYYRLLEATPNSSCTEMKRNYRKLALRHHPDLHLDPAQRHRHQERMRCLNEAYEILRDPDRKSEYDLECGFARCARHPGSFVDGQCARCSLPVCPDCCQSAAASLLCHGCAERHARRMKTADPVERALLALEDGELGLAHRALQEALLLNPRDVVALTALSTVREKQGDVVGAVAVLQLALKIKPEHSFSHYRLGILHQRLGDYSSAQDCYSEALRLCPGNQKYRGALSTLAEVSARKPEPLFRLHDQVSHSVFGCGVVTEVTECGVRVNFAENGFRWLDPVKAPMVRRPH